MAIAGATLAMTVAGFSLPIVFVKAPRAPASTAGLWNGILVALLKIQPFVATLS